MSFVVVQNGAVRQTLQMDTAFTIGEKEYSSNFLRTSSPQEKLEAGVWEVIDGDRPDDRFYWVSPASLHVNEVSSVVEASYPSTPKQLDDVTEGDVTTKGLKSQWVAQTKETAKSLMSSSDWMVIRKMERNVDVPADVAAYRTAVVTECARLVAAIRAAADVPALISVIGAQSWPDQV